MMSEAAEEGTPPSEDQGPLGPPSGPEDPRPAAPTQGPEVGVVGACVAGAGVAEAGMAVAGAGAGVAGAGVAEAGMAVAGAGAGVAGAGVAGARRTDVSVDSTLLQFKTRRFFVLRPGTLNQAIRDVEALVDGEVDGGVQSVWLLAELDHWNNEKERLVLVTHNSLLVFKYDFMMFNCEQIQRIPLNIIDRIVHGDFSFPKTSLLQREGEGLRVFWDRLREPTFTSRWNPFAVDLPSITFTHHPVRNVNDSFAALCNIEEFRVQLKDAAQKAHSAKPFPGKANGVLVLNQQILVEVYVGLMSVLGNQNKLGYCMARGNFGF